MYRRLSSWQPLVHVKIFQAQQEQMPWTEENLGYPVVPMLLKKDLLKEEDIDASQTGDYQAYFKTAETEGWIPFLVERKGGKDTKSEKRGKGNGNLKGAADIYGTLSNEKRRERFYREIDRFKLDPRFNTMYLIAECSYQDYLNYVPPFNGNKRNKDHIGMSVETRRATIAGLYIRGCIVIFAGTRTRAIQMYKDLIRQWLIKNYVSVLKLDDTPCEDEIALEDKLSQLLAEVQATKEALKITTLAMEVTA